MRMDGLIERLQGLCRSVLGPLAAPKEIILIDEMPLLPAGKPDLAQLEMRLQLQQSNVAEGETGR